MGSFDDLTERMVTVESGSAAILELPPIESRPVPEVTWFSADGTPLYGIKYAKTHNTLIILNASENDKGSYRFVLFGYIPSGSRDSSLTDADHRYS